MVKKFIDVEMLIDELSASCMPIFEKGISGILGDEQSIADVIREQPSADVQEVKHGKNTIECIPVDKFKCSECGFEIHGFSQPVHDIDGYCKYITECYFNYCPHCGARMDGD